MKDPSQSGPPLESRPPPPVAVDRPEKRHAPRPARLTVRLTRWGIQAAVAAGLIAFAVWQINVRDVATSFANAGYGWLAFALLVYVASRFVHAFEWGITLRKVGHVPFFGLLGTLLIGTLVNALVPASAGDVVKVQLVANRYGLSRAGLIAGRGAESIVNAVILVIFIAISFALPGIGFASPNILYALAGATMIAFTAAVLLSRALPHETPRWRLLAKAPPGLRDLIDRQWPRVHEGFEVIRQPRLLAIAVVLNLVGWGIDIAIYFLYGQTFGLHLPFTAYLAVTVAIALVTIFPITFGNVGTWEIAMLGVLALYGVPSDQALAFALGTHIFSTVFNVALGVIAMLALGVHPSEVFRLRRSGPSGETTA